MPNMNMKQSGETYENKHKLPVKVRADHNFDGSIQPLKVRAEEGPAIVIDRITDVRRAAATKAGGQGIRYTCQVGANELYLYHDRDWWFLEIEDREAFYVWALSNADG